VRITHGAAVRDLTESERQALQSNKGVVIRTVVDDSPAYQADVLVGDIITAIDDVEITTVRSYDQGMKEHRGRTVKLSIVRNGQRMVKALTIRA
jgi:S1-C subfamily serine protease